MAAAVALKPSGWRSVFDVHPAANAFPNMNAVELRQLGDDIAAQGLLEPITLMLIDGKPVVLDGRQRLDSMELTGVEVVRDGDLVEGIPAVFVGSSEGFDANAFAISLGLRRRHMDESARAMVAARLIRKPLSHDPDKVTAGQAAALMNVGPQSVERAKLVIKEGSPELIEAVEKGEIKVRPAAEIAVLPAVLQPAEVERAKQTTRTGKAGRAPKAKPSAPEPKPAEPKPEPSEAEHAAIVEERKRKRAADDAERAAQAEELENQPEPDDEPEPESELKEPEESEPVEDDLGDPEPVKKVSRFDGLPKTVGRVGRSALSHIATVDIRTYIDGLVLRREEIAAIPKSERVGLAKAFAIAMQLMPEGA